MYKIETPFLQWLFAIFLLMSIQACGQYSNGPVNYQPQPTQTSLSYWEKQYKDNRKDPQTILQYSTTLRDSDRKDQAVAVLSQGVLSHPKNQEIASAYGKALAASGNFDQALRVLRETQRPDTPDWRIMSTEGAILDQQGNHEQARALYNKALKISPSDPSILNNLAMSYMLTGELRKAESILLQLVKTRRSHTSTRQNLALVLGLQGRFKEAEHVARFEMPPQQAKANIDYLRSMVKQGNSWGKLQKAEQKEKSGITAATQYSPQTPPYQQSASNKIGS